MFIIQLGGGLGNQLFQFAFSIFLKEMYPEIPVKFDISNYKIINEHNGFDLPEYFEFEQEIISDNLLKMIKPGYYLFSKYGIFGKFRKQKIKVLSFVDSCLKRINMKKNLEYQVLKDSPTSDYNRGILKLDVTGAKIFFFQGNWQNILYYKDLQKVLINKMRFKVELTEEELLIVKKMKETNSVCIHIRRGDYVGTRFDLCSQDYYRNAIKKLNEISKKDYTYFIFSDDLNYAEKILQFVKKKVIVRGKTCGADMLMMTWCKNYVLANSTFSYWGAFLSKTEEKIVIVPQYAYKYQNMYYEFSTPDNWIKLDNLK